MLDFGDIIEESYERIGLEAKTGYDIRTARRSLDLLTTEWGNRGIRLWLVTPATLALTPSTASYALPTDTIDVLDGAARFSNSDIVLTRISYTTYLQIPNKTQTGRPLQFVVNRLAAPTITFWPVPDAASVFAYYRMRSVAAAGGVGATPDIPQRFIPALVAGLAASLARKKNPQLIPICDAEYEKQFDLASREDRERASFRVIPVGYR